MHAHRTCQILTCGSRAGEGLLHLHPSREVKQDPNECGLCPWNLNPASGVANAAGRIPRHFFQLLVNTEFLAKMKNTTAPFFLTHVTLAVTLFTDTAGASICQYNFDKRDYSSRITRM